MHSHMYLYVLRILHKFGEVALIIYVILTNFTIQYMDINQTISTKCSGFHRASKLAL